MLALMTWMAAISGYVSSRVHSRLNPNWAPACEYVAMPLGSSSAAPVIRPGPSFDSQVEASGDGGAMVVSSDFMKPIMHPCGAGICTVAHTVRGP